MKRKSTFKSFVRLAAHTQLLPVLESGEETLVGGQAVIEGVMMRAPHSYCVAVRKPNGEFVTEEAPLPRVSEKYPIFKYPIFRGVGTLGQAMWLGVKALKFSANAALDEGAEPKEKPAEVSSWMMTANLIFSFAFFIFLYKFVPLYLTTLLEKSFPALHGRIAFNAVDGGIRMAIFLGFLYMISRWKDIRRVFEYHGAEHKVVFNFESGKPVTVATAQTFTTLPPALRDQFPARGHGPFHSRLHSDSCRRLCRKDGRAYRIVARDRRTELRNDPLRRETSRKHAGPSYSSRTVAPEDHDQTTIGRSDRGRHSRPERSDGA